MKREPPDLDYANVVKRSLLVVLRPENLFVLLFGAAIVVLGGIFSGLLLAGPLGVGYANVCARMIRGRRADLDDVFWRGFERLGPSVVAGVILMLATSFLLFILVVPGLLSLLFAALVFSSIALDRAPRSGLSAIQRAWSLVLERPVPLVLMGLIASLVGSLATVLVVAALALVSLPLGVSVLAYFGYPLAVVATAIILPFFYVVAVFVYIHYLGEDADPRAIRA